MGLYVYILLYIFKAFSIAPDLIGQFSKLAVVSNIHKSHDHVRELCARPKESCLWSLSLLLEVMADSTGSFWQSLLWVLPGEIGVENQTDCSVIVIFSLWKRKWKVRAVHASLRVGRAGSSAPSGAALAPQRSDWLLHLSFRPLNVLHTV